MKTQRIATLTTLFSFFVLASAPAAELGIKPGLWEMKMQAKVGGKQMDLQAELKKAMANVPPEQRKMMEEMMAKQAGASLSPTGVRICISEEQVKRPEKFLAQANQGKDDDCKYNHKLVSPKKLTFDYKCDDGSNGKGEWNSKGSDAFEVTMKGTHSKQAIDLKQDGKFISKDCGKIKPAS